MSVNLNKNNKVNLSKEPVLHQHKVNLSKTPAVGYNEERVDPETVFEGQTATPYKKHGFKAWYFIPVAALLLILLAAGIWQKSTTVEEDRSLVAEGPLQEADKDELEADHVDVSEDADEVADTDADEYEDADEVAAGLAGNQEVEDDIAVSEQANDSDIDNNAESILEEDASAYIDDTAIHRYEVITADVTWEEAFQECIDRGGYLCRINSSEENEEIKSLLNENNVRGVVYLGGLRAPDSSDYHWIDENKQPFDDAINADSYLQYWYSGEPSYMDNVNDEVIQEYYMSIIYVESVEDWVWNDVNNDVLSLASGYYTGRLSYICEYE